MQSKKLKKEYILFAVPAELLLEAGIFEGDPLQMYVDGNKLIIENVDEEIKDIVCDGDCENCPVSQIECDEDCENCPCNCDESEV